MKTILAVLLTTAFLNISKAQTLHIYGGQSHDVYLGCLNCNKFDSKSIWNAFGSYGSKYSSTSIWNSFGNYGGKFSQYSPFNSYTNTPPIIVDNNGDSYGYLTINTFKSNRASFSLASTICSYWESIKDDVSGWYDKIF